MKREIIENYKEGLERINLFKSFGYDTEKEADFIIEKSLPVNGAILDVGTGKGRFALVLAKRGYCFTTVDISEDEQKYAKMNIEYFGLQKQIDFKIGNAEKLSFENKSFSVVFSVNMVHHLSKPYKVVDELIRVVNKKGKIIISDFSKQGFDLVEKIHRSEDREHLRGNTTIDDLENYFLKKNIVVKRYRTIFQEIVIAYFL